MFVFSPNTDNFRSFNEAMGFISVPFMYMHGELESAFGYDLIMTLPSFPVKGPRVNLMPGTYPATVNGIEGECTLYVYFQMQTFSMTGLLVLNSDKESVAYAQSLLGSPVGSI